MESDIRVPRQKRAIEKKEKIIKAGFDLICENGYYSTNTAEIAKAAEVSTGIVYQYFKDKHDIFMAAMEKYGEGIFFPMLNANENFKIQDFDKLIKNMIKNHIEEHKISKIAHEEITAMIHSDKEVAEYYYRKEMELTDKIKHMLLNNNFKDENLDEKVHIMLGMIDNLCHEVIYHKHKDMNYDVMTDLVISTIKELFKKDLN
jgi:AcrR family transcriptional regulator